MGEKYKVTLTHQQAQALFLASVSFAMPEKLGDDPVPPMERRDAEVEVLHLYRELKAHSPMYLKSKKFTLFGPAENWVKTEVEHLGKMRDSHEFKDPDLEIKLTLDEDAYLGAERILQLRLHSGSGNSSPIWEREDVMWPMAGRLRLTKKIRRLLKLEERQPRRLELDEMFDNEEGKSKKGNKQSPAVAPDVKEEATAKA